MHKVIQPKVLYFGTPVVLLSTVNRDGIANLAPMSSAWWLGQYCVLGMSMASATAGNLQRSDDCVMNLPSPDLVDAVDRLAFLTGAEDVPHDRLQMGYKFSPDKFEAAGVTPVESELVEPPRVRECSVQLEGRVRHLRVVDTTDHPFAVVQVEVLRVHVDEAILIPGHPNHIDPDTWSPLIMNFMEFHGLTSKVRPSRLAEVFHAVTGVDRTANAHVLDGDKKQ